MPEILLNLHFLRPWLLLVLLPAALLVWYALRKGDSLHEIQSLIAPHLLEHLAVGRKHRRLDPVYLMAAFWAIGILALAGPTWKREPSPFVRDSSTLVIVLKVSRTMTAKDIQPSRLIRSSQKIHDLLVLRPGTRTALIAYSGSSHLVMPFTMDPAIIDMFSRPLDPKIMPDRGQGDAPLRALEQAADLIRQADLPGSILLIADSLPPDSMERLDRFRHQYGVPVNLYAMAAPKGVRVPPDSPPAPPLNTEAIKKAASALGADLTVVRADNGDVNRYAAGYTQSGAAIRRAGNGRLGFLHVFGPVPDHVYRGDGRRGRCASHSAAAREKESLGTGPRKRRKRAV